MTERVKSREELQREVNELLAASRYTPSVTPTSSKEKLQQQQQQLSPQQPLQQQQHASISGDVTRKSSEKRASSEVLKGTMPVGGSLDSAGVLWASKAGRDYPRPASTVADDTAASRCLRWLPFRAIAITLKRHPSIWITSLLVFLLLATGGILGVIFIAANETQQRRLAAEGFAINAAVAFERQLAQMFFPLLSLATIIRFNPYYPAVNATFDAVAKELMEEMPTQGAVTNLIAAPQGVLRNFYPMAGYCQDKCNDININLFKNIERRDVALKTVKEGKLMMQGPLMLSQGYFGVVGRQPIYIQNSTANETFGAPDGLAYNCSVCWNATTKTQFWGFVNAVINLQSLVNGNDSRLRDLRAMGYHYEMFKYEKNESRTQIAHSQHMPVDPVVTDVHVPGGNWYLAVSPEHAWVPVWRAPILSVVVVVCGLFALLLGAILVSNKLQHWLKTANDALELEKQRMDVLLARQHNLISCLLTQQGDESQSKGKGSSVNRTLTRIEDMRREIGVAQHTNGTTSGTDELQLIELLDEGTYGKVFRGLWRGSMVAVKTMVLPANMSGTEKRERMAVMEAAISSAMNHPNIVQTYTYIIKPCATSVACAASSEGGSSSLVSAADIVPSGSLVNLESPEGNAATVHNFEVSLVLEYCDWGSLRTALDAGAFFADDNSLNYAAILDTAADVARAMLHLHKNHVLHSDLKVRNVLLKSDASGRGCIAKVADFGLAVKIDCMDTHISAFQGTMSHMAPEALLHGRISKAADIYAFGITLWELFTGGQAYQGIPRALVGHKVAVLGLRPTLPSFTPAEFKALVEDCWHQDPEKRPCFEAILVRLLKMRQDLGIAVTPPLQRYKLRAKSTDSRVEKRNSSETAEPNASEAQAQGLLQLGSYYVNSVQSSTSITKGSGDGSMQNSTTCAAGPASAAAQQNGTGAGTGSGHSGQGGPAVGAGSMANGYQRAPRTSYLGSRLYSLTGSMLGPIADTEDWEEEDAKSGSASENAADTAAAANGAPGVDAAAAADCWPALSAAGTTGAATVASARGSTARASLDCTNGATQTGPDIEQGKV